MNLNVSCPINSVSFGHVSYNILRELYNRGISPNIMPISGVDLSSFDRCPEDFKLWLQSCINKSLKNYKREYPGFKLWHIQNSEAQYSNNQSLLTFSETDEISEYQQNILANQKSVIVTSSYTKGILENYGLSNVHFTPLGFDSENFRRIEKRPYDNDTIAIGIFGKFEAKRKHTDQAIKAFLRLYGNNKAYRLHLHTFNPFLGQNPEQIAENNKNLVLQCYEGKQYWNVNVVNGHLNTLTEYNKMLNSVDLVFDCGGNEGFGLPQFHATAMGKHLVTAYSNAVCDWADEENAVLIQPTAKEECYDSMFFHKGSPWTQGNFFTFEFDNLVAGLERGVERYKSNPINTAGLELQKKFLWKDTVDKIISIL